MAATERGLQTDARYRRGRAVLVGYPLAVLLVATLVNGLAFDIGPIAAALPESKMLKVLAASSMLAVLNHSWIMTSTELTRLRFNLFATTEEQLANGQGEAPVSEEGLQELTRKHNLHRNTTENTVVMGVLTLAMALASPEPDAFSLWVMLFALSRLGYTYSYINKNTAGRGICMTLGLLAMYGLGSYLAWGLLSSAA